MIKLFPTELRKILEKIWCKETAYRPSLKIGKQCQSRGQCYVTALLVRDILGGAVIHGWVKNNLEKREHHFWNLLPDKTEIDLTSDQYGGDGLYPVNTGAYLGVYYISKYKNKRYLLLKRKFEEFINA